MGQGFCPEGIDEVLGRETEDARHNLEILSAVVPQCRAIVECHEQMAEILCRIVQT